MTTATNTQSDSSLSHHPAASAATPTQAWGPSAVQPGWNPPAAPAGSSWPSPPGTQATPSRAPAPGAQWGGQPWQAPRAPRNVRSAATRNLGSRMIAEGFLLIFLGVAITVGTIVARLPVFVVSWGPVVVGVARVAKGIKLLSVGAPAH